MPEPCLLFGILGTRVHRPTTGAFPSASRLAVQWVGAHMDRWAFARARCFGSRVEAMGVCCVAARAIVLRSNPHRQFARNLAAVSMLTTDSPASAFKHRSTGQERDTESGLDYFGARQVAQV